MEIKQTLLPSVHLLENFMPYRRDELRMIDVLKKAIDIGYYRGVELGLFFDRWNRMAIRQLIEENDLNLTIFATPYLKDHNLNLNSPDSELRKKSLDYALSLIPVAANEGCTNLGFPSGDDPGDELRRDAKKYLADSINTLAQCCRSHGMNMTLEPLDRYAFKKQLIGPMKETAEWFAPLHRDNPNFFIHWDSAHEALGGTQLMWSLEWASPYIAQFHLCDAILDANHPCYGDLHMDVASGPDFKTEGFLTPEIGAEILKKVSSFEKPAGVRDTYVSIEMLGHPGDDLWAKEAVSRAFLKECFRLAGLN